MDEDLRARLKSQPYAPRQPQPSHRTAPKPTTVESSHHHSAPHTHQPTVPAPKPVARTAPKRYDFPAVDSRGRTKSKSRKIWVLVVVIIIIGGLAAGGWFWAYPKYITQPNPFPATIQNKVSYSLFYPAKLPSGFAISQSSYNLANNTVTYRATKGDKKIVFTMQKAPAGLDFNAFYKQQLTDIQNYTTQFGPGVIGVNDNRQLGSLVANGTWVLLTTNSSSVNRDDISLVMNNLQKY